MYNSHECDVRIVLSHLTEDEAFKAEQKLIKYYRETSSFRLTNQTDGGEGSSGFHHTAEARRKISQASRKTWEDADFRNFAKKLRTDPCGPYQSEAFRNKISQKTQGCNNPNYGHFWTEEMKEKLRTHHQELGRYEGSKNPRAKKIQCLETGEIFDCMREAQKKYSVKSLASFSIALDKPNRTAAKLHWVSV